MTRRPQLLAVKCTTCVFRPGNLMHLREGRFRDLIAANLAADAALICHKTLPHGEHPEVGPAVCRGYYDVHRRDVLAIRLVEAVGGFEVIPEPC
jgi:hypothetical protein